MSALKDVKDLPAVPKEVARKMQEDALASFLASGGNVEVLKGRKNPKLPTANGKSNSGMKTKSDPTARFPKKEF
jgi:hypothetical protein